jgi:lincosamide and streptogramin A transport system ATP-binding/permease protein
MADIILQHIHFHYPSPYVKIFEDLSLRIDTAWKTALIGRNGRGKTTLLNLLCQKLSPARGHLEIPIKMSYFPYAPEDSQLTTFEVIKDSILKRTYYNTAGFPNVTKSLAAIK